MKKFKIFQTFYNNLGYKQINQDLCSAYDVSHNLNDPFLEYTIFKEIVKNNTTIEYIGILSWKFEAKTQIKLQDFLRFIQESIDLDYDFIFINPMIASESIYLNVWEHGIVSHPPMYDLIMNLFQSNIEINILEKHDVNSFAFCNYFVANQKTWQKYFEFVDGILLNIKNLSYENLQLARIWEQTASYGRNNLLTIKPFFIERLLSTFIISQNIITNSYKYSLEQYILRFGSIAGKRLHDLSTQKLALNSSNLIDMDKWKHQQTSVHKSPIMGSLKIEDLSDLILFEN